MNIDLEKLRIAIAEKRGWKYVKRIDMERRAQWWLEPPHRWQQYRPEWAETNVQEKQPIEWCGYVFGGVASVPDYPRDPAAALELVEWMAKPENGGWNSGWLKETAKMHKFMFWRENHYSLTNTQIDGYADTLPLAICLAFAKANNTEVATV